MTRDPSDENKNLPPWLRDVPLPPRPRGADEPAALAASSAPPAPAGPPSSASLPDWLRDSSAAEPASPPDVPGWMDRPAQVPVPTQTSEQAALPDWLRDAQPSPNAGAEQLPSWLSDLAGTDTPASEPPPLTPPPAPLPAVQPQSESGLPDWLRDTQRDAVPSSGAEQLPSWLAESDVTPHDADQPAGDTPSWLSGLDIESPAAAESPAAPDWLSGANNALPPTTPAAAADTGVPDWLNSASEAAPPAPADTGVPDWLNSTSDPDLASRSETESLDLWAPEPTAAPEQPRDTSSNTGVPDWLRDISAGESNENDITAEPFSFGDTTSTSQPAESAGPPAWLSVENSSEDVPDWLRSAVDQSKDLASAAPELPAVPLWLQDVERQPADSAVPAAPETTPSTPTPAAEPESLPPWLRDETAQTTDAPPAAPQPPPPSAADDVPAWLHASEPAIPSSPAADVPAWLQSEPTSADAASTPFPPAQDDDTLPGIMRADLAAPAFPAPVPPPADDLPDWLRPSTPSAAPDAAAGQDLPPWLRDESGQPLPSAGSPGDNKLPAWLRGAAMEGPPAAPTNEQPPAPANFEWLDQAAQADSRRTANESEFFGSTELPAWLRPPEPEQPKEISQADARSLDWLTRLGGTDEPDTTVAPSVAAPKLAPLVTRPRSPAQIEALALLERLAAAPFSEPAPLAIPAQPSMWRRIGIERALYLLLLIALIVGLIVPLPDSFGLAVPPSAPGAAELFEQIDKLSANDIVLVGYEWDARRSSELRPLEDAVLGHLIQRKVKLVLASTDPQGTLLLFDFRDQLEKAGYRKGGEDYILLGYKPGAELALRLFAQDFHAVLQSDFQGNDATISALATGADPSKPRLTSLNDFAMVMVLADEAQDVQGWMEQIHRSARQVPLAFLLPNETTPVAQPYLSQSGIFHLAGKQGALAYQSLRGDSGMPAAQIARETTQQRLSLLVFIALLLLGALIVGVGAAVARRRRAP
ncbi:MAG: hypothetical protein ABIV47_24010 [Roseiflexaceae bacterium]